MTTPDKHSTMYMVVAPLIILASTAMSLYLGILAESLYRKGSYAATGWITGLISGLVVGILYLIAVEAKRSCPIFSAHLILYSTLAGTAAGTAAATALHITLMIVYKTTQLDNLGIGIAFGATTGTILGVIAALLLKKAYKIKKQPENTENPPTSLDT